MKKNEEKTIPIISVTADKGQSLQIKHNNIISEEISKFNGNLSNYSELYTISMSELFDNIYTPRVPVIDNFLYTGIYLFVGAPKVGKSFFMALLSYHVSTGEDLWNYNTHKGVVLYLALEDSYGRLQDRFSKMFGTDNNDNLHFSTISNQIGNGLEEQLNEFITKYPNTKLIIIDTLQKVRESLGDKFSYASDYDVITKLKKFSDTYNICILIVHHTRKQAADDSFETISGSNGLLGAADGAFILQKEKRISNKAILELVGRDQQDQKLYIEFNRETLLWGLIKAETEISNPPHDPILVSLAKILTKDTPIWSGTASELLLLLENSGLQPNTLTRKLNVSVERLINEYGICYENYRTHNGKLIKLKLLKVDE